MHETVNQLSYPCFLSQSLITVSGRSVVLIRNKHIKVAVFRFHTTGMSVVELQWDYSDAESLGATFVPCRRFSNLKQLEPSARVRASNCTIFICIQRHLSLLWWSFVLSSFTAAWCLIFMWWFTLSMCSVILFTQSRWIWSCWSFASRNK